MWANFYDWDSDDRLITDTYKTACNTSVTDHPELKYGFTGFKTLHDNLKFDVVFTRNVNYDSREKGFNVKWIELAMKRFGEFKEAKWKTLSLCSPSRAHGWDWSTDRIVLRRPNTLR